MTELRDIRDDRRGIQKHAAVSSQSHYSELREQTMELRNIRKLLEAQFRGLHVLIEEP